MNKQEKEPKPELQTVIFNPSLQNQLFIKDVQIQIIYKVMGIIEIYEHPTVPNAFQFEATRKQQLIIQKLTTKCLNEIVSFTREYALYYLFMQGMFVAGNLHFAGYEPIKQAV